MPRLDHLGRDLSKGKVQPRGEATLDRPAVVCPAILAQVRPRLQVVVEGPAERCVRARAASRLWVDPLVEVGKLALGLDPGLLEFEHVGRTDGQPTGLAVGKLALNHVRFRVRGPGDQDAEAPQLGVPVQDLPAARVRCRQALDRALGQLQLRHEALLGGRASGCPNNPFWGPAVPIRCFRTWLG